MSDYDKELDEILDKLYWSNYADGVASETGGGYDREYAEKEAKQRLKHLLAQANLDGAIEELEKLTDYVLLNDMCMKGLHERSYNDRIATLKEQREKL